MFKCPYSSFDGIFPPMSHLTPEKSIAVNVVRALATVEAVKERIWQFMFNRTRHLVFRQNAKLKEIVTFDLQIDSQQSAAVLSGGRMIEHSRLPHLCLGDLIKLYEVTNGVHYTGRMLTARVQGLQVHSNRYDPVSITLGEPLDGVTA
jgi:hypothetical protein